MSLNNWVELEGSQEKRLDEVFWLTTSLGKLCYEETNSMKSKRRNYFLWTKQGQKSDQKQLTDCDWSHLSARKEGKGSFARGEIGFCSTSWDVDAKCTLHSGLKRWSQLQEWESAKGKERDWERKRWLMLLLWRVVTARAFAIAVQSQFRRGHVEREEQKKWSLMEYIRREKGEV